jgi:hypothetical protein
VTGKTSVADLLQQVSADLAKTDAAVYRRVGQHISATKQALAELAPDQSGPLALLSGGDFNSMTVAALKKLCSGNGIKRVSAFKKPELVAVLKKHGVQAPPTPIEKLTKGQLVDIVKELLARG